jgi:putative heme-binding domain-containing protein
MLMAPILIPYLLAAFADGEGLYLSQCSICHGQKGEGGRGSPLTRKVLRHAPDDAALQRVIRRGIPDTEMPSSWMNEEEVRQVAAYVRTLSQQIGVSRVPGDPRLGAQIYNGKGACSNCHTLQGSGGAFGPDLTSIGERRSPAHLRESIVNPGAEVTAGHFEIHVITKSGQTIRGIRVNEDTFSIQLRDASNQVHSLWKDDLRSIDKKMQSSLMPGYGKSLSPTELDDVIAYLVNGEAGK